MKKFLLLFCLFTTSWTFAQNNLQFSRVVTMQNGSNISVPPGKVWKIESINFSNTLSFSPGSLANVSCQTISSSFPNNRQCDYSGPFITIGNVSFNTPILSYVSPATTCASACPTTNPITLSTSSLNANSFILPIWLEAEKNITIVSGSGILISILEFNIVQ